MNIAMVSFTATVKKFGSKGEKSGWFYVEVPAGIATQLKPGHKKGFRVKGSLDKLKISMVALLPAGEGDFILPLNAAVRKAIKKTTGDNISVCIEPDENLLAMPPGFKECLEDEPAALIHFNTLPLSHKNYFIRWIGEAKTDATRAKRIVHAVDGLLRGKHFGEILREMKKSKENSNANLPDNS